MTPIIRFENVGKRYHVRAERPRSFRDAFVRRRLFGPSRAADPNGLWALRDVSFDVQPGETVGLVGANGAGKSTALKLISRVVVPTLGRLDVRGRVAALLELGTGFHPDLSGRDNIFLSASLVGMGRGEIARRFDSVVDFSELAAFIDMPVKHYSSGMFARLAFAVSIHLDPEVLLVDEVLAVGDQAFQRKCLDRIAQLKGTGVTVCMVSHDLDAIRTLCRRAIWFEHGRLRADGNADLIVRQYLQHVNENESTRLARGAAPGDGQPPLLDRRWGTREIEIVRVTLRDRLGAECQIFSTGEPFMVEMEYVAHQPLPPPVFGLSLSRQDGVHVTGPNTAFAGLDLPPVRGPGRVQYTVRALPLLEGLYDLSVAATNLEDTHTYDYHDRLYAFRVVNSGAMGERYGLLTLGGEWRHQPASAQPVAPGAHTAAPAE